MNMSARILRKIVAKYFRVEATKVTISGKLNLNEEWSTSVYYNGTERSICSTEVFTFCVKKYFHKLDVVLSSYYDWEPTYEDGPCEWVWKYDNNTPKYDSIAMALAEECPESVFVVVVDRYKGEKHNDCSITLYEV